VTYFLVAGAISGLSAWVITGIVFRGAPNPHARRYWLFILWALFLVLSYIPA